MQYLAHADTAFKSSFCELLYLTELKELHYLFHFFAQWGNLMRYESMNLFFMRAPGTAVRAKLRRVLVQCKQHRVQYPGSNSKQQNKTSGMMPNTVIFGSDILWMGYFQNRPVSSMWKHEPKVVLRWHWCFTSLTCELAEEGSQKWNYYSEGWPSHSCEVFWHISSFLTRTPKSENPL